MTQTNPELVAIVVAVAEIFKKVHTIVVITDSPRFEF